jgi:signal transduction histidine kinase
MLAFVITNGILPIYHIIWQFVYSPVFLVPIAVSSAVAMYRYRFFDLPYQTLKILRNGTLLLTFSIIGIISFEVLSLLLMPGKNLLNFLISAVLSLFLLQKIEKILPEFASSSFKEFRYKIDSLKSSIYYCNNYQDLFKKLESVFLLDLHFNSVQLFLIRSKKNHIEIPIYYKDRYTESIEKEQIKILVKEEIKLQKNQFYAEFLEKMDSSLCFPLYLEKRLIGFFSLGPKSKKEYFSREEIEELMKAKQFVELCFINILLQSDLKEENDLMKQLIHEKTKSLKKQNEKIKYLLNQQSDFIAVTAHEFRTPLNIALLQLEDTLDSYEHSTHVLADMKVLESSLEKLKHLTQNLFDVQQYDLNKVKIYTKEIDLNWFINDIYEEFRDIMAKKKHHLSLKNNLKKPTMVQIDEPKMRQVMHNLLTNAQKFTQENGNITIQAEAKKDLISLSVIDNGPGISKNDKQRIFEKFQTTKSHMGMGIGLGLYLCKSIVDLHKGFIEIHDTPGGGATFLIKFPKGIKTTDKPKKG